MSSQNNNNSAVKDPEVTVNAWVCQGGGQALALGPVTLPPLTHTQVHVKLLACGICKSDVDALMGVYEKTGRYTFPMVAGHEGVGRVEVVGDYVTHLKVGDLVGLGVFRSSCGACTDCAEGRTNLCGSKALMFAYNAKGCFSEYLRIEARFAFKLPEGMKIEDAAPLMCAGITVLAPFRNLNITAGSKVGVVGIGGLGHLALQFGKSFGCEVFAFSTSTNKETECRQLGAHHFINTNEETSKNSVIGKLDYLLMTASGSGVDYKYLMRTLNANGTLVILGLTGLADIPVSPIELVLFQKKICGSAAGSQAIYLDTLNFCSFQKIKPIIQTWPVAKINDAIAAVKDGSIRYRAVVLF